MNWCNKIDVLSEVVSNPFQLQNATDELRDDKDLILNAVKLKGLTLEFASQRLRGDKSVVLIAIHQNYTALQFASPEIKNDLEFILDIVRINGNALKYASRSMKNNRDVVLIAINNSNGSAFKYATSRLRRNYDVLISAINKGSYSFHIDKVPPSIWDDQIFAMMYGYSRYRIWSFFSERLRSTPEVVLRALEIPCRYSDIYKHWVQILKSVPDQLRLNISFLLRVIKVNYRYMAFMEPYKFDRGFVLDAVKIDGNAIKKTSDELQRDPEIIWNAVMVGKLNLPTASPKLLSKIEDAFKNHGLPLVTVNSQPEVGHNSDFLMKLNGNQNGHLKDYLDGFKGEPRIAWYPSAGRDFRPLIFLNPAYREVHPAVGIEPASPDIFFFTDYFPWQNSDFLGTGIIFSDDRTTIQVIEIEILPPLNLPIHPGIVDSPAGGPVTGQAYFLRVEVSTNKFGTFSYPIIYAFVENESFYCNKLAPSRVSISHVIHVRYGGGYGGGGAASGAWLLNILKGIKCELFITDGHLYIQNGDRIAMRLCPHIPNENNVTLTSIRLLNGESWSNHGDVRWNLVS